MVPSPAPEPCASGCLGLSSYTQVHFRCLLRCRYCSLSRPPIPVIEYSCYEKYLGISTWNFLCASCLLCFLSLHCIPLKKAWSCLLLHKELRSTLRPLCVRLNKLSKGKQVPCMGHRWDLYQASKKESQKREAIGRGFRGSWGLQNQFSYAKFLIWGLVC